MTADRCLCSHVPDTHTDGRGNCWSVVCGCREYRREPAPPPSPAEQAVLRRFENTRPAPESYRSDEEDQ